MTEYQSKYFANYITLQNPNVGPERLGPSLLNATIDMNPHQIEWALFFFNNPLSDWILLADEVWLWKTIEAWLVLSQLRSELKRKIILIVPASLRKQWKQELEEKFFIPNEILDWKTYFEFKRSWKDNPFDQKNKIIITSYQFAAKHEEDLIKVNWDVAVFDEAHSMRNVYRNPSWTAAKLKRTFKSVKKLLLTATPLQNSLLELYWLVSYIDEYTFWNLDSFKKQFSSPNQIQLDDLKQRLKPIMHRTLRSQVKEYIRYTKRIPLTENFDPTDIEVELYDKISEFLQREDIKVISPKTRHLIILILRKLLASSSYAIAWTLDMMINKIDAAQSLEEVFDEDELEEYDERMDDDDEKLELAENLKQMRDELEELKWFRDLARWIKVDSKTIALEKALKTSFAELEKMGANRKALIFTWFKRTQKYVVKYLEEHWYEWKIVTFNWSNNDARSNEIYKKWLEKYQWTSKISGSRSADMRAALVEYFKEEADIMVATESAAEWVNLQFCSLVINYDLPWNPQRIEQRIWRCHRYWQQFDVIVMNFINSKNYADQRVFELLSEKFDLFKWVFDASDSILWEIWDWTDFEQKILNIYQTCRTKEEIDAAFEALEKEYKPEIDTKMKKAKKDVMENFDAQVVKILKNIQQEWMAKLDTYKEMFWDLSKDMLSFKNAIFNDNDLTFNLFESPDSSIPTWNYTIDKDKTDTCYFHRPQWELWELLIHKAKNLSTEPWHVVFYPDKYHSNISALQKMKWQSWWLRADKLVINSFANEEYLLLSCIDDDWKLINQEIASKMMLLPSENKWEILLMEARKQLLEDAYDKVYKETLDDALDRNAEVLEDQILKLDSWENDRKMALDRDIKDLEQLLKQIQREIIKEKDREKRFWLLKEKSKLEEQLDRKQEELISTWKTLRKEKNKMIEQLNERMNAGNFSEPLFTIKRSIE